MVNYLRYHCVKGLVKEQHIKVEYKSTKLNIADLFTKPVTPQVIEQLMPYLSGIDTSWKDILCVAGQPSEHQTIVHKAHRAQITSQVLDIFQKEIDELFKDSKGDYILSQS